MTQYKTEVLNYDNYNPSLVHSYIINDPSVITSNMNVCDSNGHTLMHIACTYNDIETVQFLINNGTAQTVNAINSNEWNPLRIVSHFGYVTILKMLLDTHNCDINTVNSECKTALYYATLSCRDDAVQELINNGAKMYVNNKIQIATNCNLNKYIDIMRHT